MVVAEGSTADVLADEHLLAAHRLELPFGSDPDRIGQDGIRGSRRVTVVPTPSVESSS